MAVKKTTIIASGKPNLSDGSFQADMTTFRSQFPTDQYSLTSNLY